jgi:hypothetical protein
MEVVVDASDPIARLREVAVWSFDLSAWGECTQAPSESDALSPFAARVHLEPEQLQVVERITGPEAIFFKDTLPASDEQIAKTIEILSEQRARTLAIVASTTDTELDAEEEGVVQPGWMTWRTPRQILRHIADTEARAYPRWCGLPELEPVEDLRLELARSALHVRDTINEMPRTFRTEHRGEVWTPVKLLRRLAWHERVESVFLRRRLRAS